MFNGIIPIRALLFVDKIFEYTNHQQPQTLNSQDTESKNY